MFAPETYRPTHQGPFLATGETLRRARNDAQAVGDSQSVARAYYRPMRGVAAGSPMGGLRANMAADAGRSRATAQSMQAYNQLVQQNAMANLAAQTMQAQELRGLADLLRSGRETDYMRDAASADRASAARVFERQMQMENEARRLQNRQGERELGLGILGGLVGGLAFGPTGAVAGYGLGSRVGRG